MSPLPSNLSAPLRQKLAAGLKNCCERLSQSIDSNEARVDDDGQARAGMLTEERGDAVEIGAAEAPPEPTLELAPPDLDRLAIAQAGCAPDHVGDHPER